MHCLYCDRPLALLKRLTGDGEFCSKEHRKIYQREHNQLALERLLETQPASNRKTPPNPPKRSVPAFVEPEPEPIAPDSPAFESFAAEPADPGSAPTENLPDLAEFLASWPQESAVEARVLQFTGDPILKAGAPISTGIASEAEWKHIRSPQPKTAQFHSESPQPQALDGAIRHPETAGFAENNSPQLERNLPLYEPPATRQPGRAEFVSPVYAAAERPSDRIEGLVTHPRWKPFEAILTGRFSGRIVFVMGSLLPPPARTSAGQNGSSEIYEIRLKPISFPPLSPRMACLEERLHRTDRIGFCPP